MFRTFRMLRNPKTRQSLWWDLKRIWVEHRYQEELSRLSALVDSGQFYLAQLQAEALRESSPYLEPEIVRYENLMSFLTN